MNGRLGMTGPASDRGDREIYKAAPLDTTLDDDQARKVVGRVGLKGPLPKELSRDQRMTAYEARYLHAGGRKAQHWQRRSEAADKVRGTATATGVTAAAAVLASRLKHAPKLMKTPAFGHRVENAALGSAVTAGTAGLASDYSRKRRAAYSSAPGGVAASALRRMREYTP